MMSQRGINIAHQVSDPHPLPKVKYHQHKIASALAEGSNETVLLQAVNRELYMVFTRGLVPEAWSFLFYFKDDYAYKAALLVKHKDMKTGGTSKVLKLHLRLRRFVVSSVSQSATQPQIIFPS